MRSRAGRRIEARRKPHLIIVEALPAFWQRLSSCRDYA